MGLFLFWLWSFSVISGGTRTSDSAARLSRLPGEGGRCLRGHLQPRRGAPDAEWRGFVLHPARAPTLDWQRGSSNESRRHIESVKSKPERRRCPVVVWVTSWPNSWSLANMWKNVERRRHCKLRPGSSPWRNALLGTMRRPGRLGSGCCPAGLLLLVYTSLCAVGGESPLPRARSAVIPGELSPLSGCWNPPRCRCGGGCSGSGVLDSWHPSEP